MRLTFSITAARPLIILFLAALVLTACSREGIYDAAMDREKSKAGMEVRTLEVDGMDISYLEGPRRDGQETLVMVHGFGANNLNWLRLARHLQADYHLIAPDLPGHGQSTRDMSLNYSIENQVENLAAILQALDVESAHLAGNSMGGAIVALYGAVYPERTLSLSLLNPAGIQDHPAELDQRIEAGNNPLVVNDPSEYGDLMDFVMEQRPFIPWPITGVMAERAAANQEINQKIFEDIRGGSAADFRDQLQHIAAPTLVLWGAEDRVLNAKNAPVFGELITNSRVVVMDGVGHVPMIEVPERTAAEIRQTAGE